MTTPAGRSSHPSRRQALAAAVGLAGVPTFPPHRPLSAAEGAKVKKPLRPAVVAFDVIETLFDLAPLRDRFKEAGLPPDALPEWFARMLRDAMALTITDAYTPFRCVARGTLEVMLAEAKVAAGADKVDAVLAGFGELPAHPDTAPAFERLKEVGVRAVTLTNGGAENTRKLLKKAGLDGLVERVVTVDEVKKWKPAKEVYLHAAGVAKVEPGRLALVAAHDWDCHGAKQAGLVTGFVARKGTGYHPAMDPPDVKGPTLKEVIDGLLALPNA